MEASDDWSGRPAEVILQRLKKRVKSADTLARMKFQVQESRVSSVQSEAEDEEMDGEASD